MNELILLWIAEFVAKNQYPPSISEIAEHFGIVKSAVHYHLKQLRDDGLLTWEPTRARTLTLTKESDG